MASNPFAVEPQYGEQSVPLAMSQPPVGMTQALDTPPPQKGVLTFHILFKALALFFYMTDFASSYVLTFVLVTIMSALDFWTVKNVSGRLLVGLRWWNVIDEDGKSHWQFQSFEDQRFIHSVDSNVFWVTLFVAPAVWVFMAFAAALTLRFMWLLLTLVALACCAINTVGYVRCKRDAAKKLTNLGGAVLSRGLQAWSSARGSSGGTAPI
mmetsp:Transcript_10995/g.22223  ORF Transcript_10995/g.22223 Transcript_10995/m.22223 type:complete len:210 (-) Transcript_10995:416-1045(-)